MTEVGVGVPGATPWCPPGHGAWVQAGGHQIRPQALPPLTSARLSFRAARSRAALALASAARSAAESRGAGICLVRADAVAALSRVPAGGRRGISAAGAGAGAEAAEAEAVAQRLLILVRNAGSALYVPAFARFAPL